MTVEKFQERLYTFTEALRTPLLTDAEILQKIDQLQRWIDVYDIRDEFDISVDVLLSLGQEMRGFYSRIFSNEFSTEEELVAAYNNDLSELAQNLYSEYVLIDDWENRQDSDKEYEEYLEILKKPYFLESELKDAYEKSLNWMLHSDRSDRIQLKSWEDFRKTYVHKIAKTGSLLKSSVVGVDFNMIFCSKGTFEMGHRYQKYNSESRLEVIESSFILGETEVTQELYEAVMGINPSYFKNSLQNPVEQVSWEDAILFCNRLSELQGLDNCYTKNPKSLDYGWVCDFKKNGYRLPREEEWEYAAKAGTKNQWSGTNSKVKLPEYAWFRESYPPISSTHPVKKKKPNSWGFYDMSGNVRELCWDKYNRYSNYYAWDERVSHGGSWWDSDLLLCSAYRVGGRPDYRDDRLGFRICRTVV